MSRFFNIVDTIAVAAFGGVLGWMGSKIANASPACQMAATIGGASSMYLSAREIQARLDTDPNYEPGIIKTIVDASCPMSLGVAAGLIELTFASK